MKRNKNIIALNRVQKKTSFIKLILQKVALFLTVLNVVDCY